MKYAELFNGGQDNRNTVLVTATTTTADYKKTVTKALVAMVKAGDCKAGEMKEHALKITGRDIKSNFSSIYELVAVFTAVIDQKIEITEEEFDSMESSKLALLSPFLSKPELADLIPDAVDKAKNGTAKDIRELKPDVEKKEPKAVKEIREKFEAAEKQLEEAKEREKAFRVPCQFAVTDLMDPSHPLLTSPQVQARILGDSAKAADFHAVFMLKFAAKILRDNPGIAEMVGAQCGSEVGEIFEALTRTATAPEERAAIPA